MNRIEELSLMYVDGLLTPETEQELVSLVTGNPDAAREFMGIARIDAELRGRMIKTDVSKSVMETISDQEAKKIQKKVIQSVAIREREGRASVDMLKIFRRVLVPLAAAALIVGAIGAIFWLPPDRAADSNRIVTGKGQTIALKFDGEDTLVEMAENTILKVIGGTVVTSGTANVELVQTGPRKTIQLEAGSIKVSVAKQLEGRSFVVNTPQAEMRVVGTKFSVNMGVHASQTRLTVQEGIVRLTSLSSGLAAYVRAGDVANVETGKAVDLAGTPVREVRTFMLGDKAAIGDSTGNWRVFSSDGKRLWVGASDGCVLLGIDAETGDVVERLDLTGRCSSILATTWGGGSLWAIAKGKTGPWQLMKINPADTTVETGFPALPPGEVSVAYGDGSVWLVGWKMSEPCVIMRVDPGTRKTLSTVKVKNEYAGEAGLVWFDGGLWLYGSISGNRDRLTRLDTESGNELVFVQYPGSGYRGMVRIAAGNGSTLWGLRRGMPYRTGQVVQFDALFAGAKGRELSVNSNQ
ncbi:MAG: hypothetical protein C0404_11415 [Verrucomicrobia bacterium]|nr:hypothetical protein [Verrucomicrobiota bacterium]